MAFSKRCFSTVPALRRLSPEVLRDLLELFPGFLAERGLSLPAGPLGKDALDYSPIRDALMSDDVPADLDDVLYLSSLLGNAAGWDLIRRQASETGGVLPEAGATLGYVDLAIRAATKDWPKHKDLLERSNARARVHSRSSYVYYAPFGDPRGAYRTPTAAGLAGSREALAEHYAQQGLVADSRHGRGTEIVPYDFEKEIWFLIRYPGRQSRHSGCDRNGDWQHYVFNPESYDAVAYNKAYADLRMNTQRKIDHRKYRIVFGDLLFGGASNVFRPKADVVSLAPLKSVNAADLFNCDDIGGLAQIAPVEIVYDFGIMPTIRHSQTALEGGTLLSGKSKERRLVPENTLCVRRVVFRYRLQDQRRFGRLVLQTGNRVNYERDGDSVVIEDFLRCRGFVKSYVDEHDVKSSVLVAGGCAVASA